MCSLWYKDYFAKPRQTVKDKPPVKQESVINKENLLGTVPWEKDDNETEKQVSTFKMNALSDYPDVTLEMAFDKEITTVIKEQYAEVDDSEYYSIDYNYDNQNYVAVIVKESETIQLAELYYNDKKVTLDSEEGHAYQEEVFEITYAKTEAEKNNFNENRTGMYSNGYWAMDLKAIDNNTKTIVYDGYEYGASVTSPAFTDGTGKIIDANTLEIYGVTIHFIDDSAFEIEKGTDAMIFSSQVGGSASHDVAHGSGQYVKDKAPNEEFTLPKTASVTIASGIFWEQDKAPSYARYYIKISNVTSTSFDFEIFGRDSETPGDSYRTVFKYNKATYIDGNTAVFKGKQYTLTFQCYDPGYVTISGFSEWIPDGSTLYNNVYLGVS